MVTPTPIGEFDEVLPAFSDLMVHWLAAIPPVRRLAFGARLLQPVEPPESGSVVLSNQMRHPTLTLTPQITDFNLQLNRRRPSDVLQGLGINVMRRWAVSQWATVEIAAGAPLTVGRPAETADLELDINTTPDYPNPLPGPELRRLWAELVQIGQRVAREGEPAA